MRLKERWKIRPAHPWWRRVHVGLRHRFAAVVGKSQRVDFVDFGGHRFKRIVFGDAWQAARIARGIEEGAFVGLFPPVVLLHEDNLLLRFVEGRPFDPDRDLDALTRFYARLYGHEPLQLSLSQTPWDQRLRTDIAFLRDTGVLLPERAQSLLATAETLRPEEVWVGWDFTDPVTKNFVVADGALVAIDVENLERGMLLGTGLCKARRHWMSPAQLSACVEGLRQAGAPDLSRQLPYADLAQLAGWTKRKLLQGKRGFIRPQAFDAWLTAQGRR